MQLTTCVKKPESLQVYETFFDGSPIIEVLLRIDPEPTQPVPTTSNLQGLSITAARIKIFHCIIKNIKSIYEVSVLFFRKRQEKLMILFLGGTRADCH